QPFCLLFDAVHAKVPRKGGVLHPSGHREAPKTVPGYGAMALLKQRLEPVTKLIVGECWIHVAL
ncbi:MAG TPA: hypothetical protein VFE05_04245, partial [Longimicrobiaceae bacterium]|nr:hypothetical protein [Longimicrobiaceae bacterium]